MRKTYLVTWQIDMEADSPQEAAALALMVQRDNCPDNAAVVFDVQAHGESEVVRVDLFREEEA